MLQPLLFDEGDVLLKEGGYVKFIPLVLSGLIKVYVEKESGHEVLLYYINQGESCIMSSTYCMQNRKSRVKAIVEEAAQVILVPAEKAKTYNRQYTGWNEFLFALFQEKYNELLDIISILTFENKDKRLINYLERERELKGSPTIHITHQQIANDIGTTREVVSRLLKKLENEGVLVLAHRKIILKK
ncbi:MAG: Crp/Fnr family transcriptional regulator [Bacteroidota bacterium]